jgi:hypothetical protein
MNFASAVAYGFVGFESQSVAVADVNGDGKQDLVFVGTCENSDCDTSGTVAVMLGNGDGTFQSAVLYPTGGIGATAVAVADVNGDGIPDLVVANSCASYGNCGNSVIGILFGKGDGTFDPAVTYDSGGGGADSVAVADVNGDGIPDLLIANECVTPNNCAYSSVAVLLGNSDGTFQKAVTYDSGGVGTTSVAAADLNGDGIPDIVLANWCVTAIDCDEGGVGVLLGAGSGTFKTAVTYSSGGPEALAVIAEDVSGDGKPDIVVANQFDNNFNFGTVSVLVGNGDGTFAAAVPYNSGGYDARGVSIGDVNGDGKPDLIVANGCSDFTCADSGTMGVLLGNGDGTFQAAADYGTGGAYDLHVAVADVNGDGKPDVLAVNVCVSNTSCPNGSVGVLINTSLGETETELFPTAGASYFGQRVVFRAKVEPLGFKHTPTGTVGFFDGKTNLVNSVLNARGVAKALVSSLAAGAHSITALYQGDGNYVSSSSAPLAHWVHRAPSKVVLVSSANPVAPNHKVFYKATVTGRYGGPTTGTVTFEDDDATTTVPLNGTTAILVSAYPHAGTHEIRAIYSGDGNNEGSKSNLLLEHVRKGR